MGCEWVDVCVRSILLAKPSSHHNSHGSCHTQTHTRITDLHETCTNDIFSRNKCKYNNCISHCGCGFTSVEAVAYLLQLIAVLFSWFYKTNGHDKLQYTNSHTNAFVHHYSCVPCSHWTRHDMRKRFEINQDFVETLENPLNHFAIAVKPTERTNPYLFH